MSLTWKHPWLGFRGAYVHIHTTGSAIQLSRS